MRVIDNATGNEVIPGDTIRSFRGEAAKLGYPDAPQTPGKSGKVCVLWQPSGQRGWYYDKVFGLTVLSDADYAALYPELVAVVDGLTDDEKAARETVNRFIDAQ